MEPSRSGVRARSRSPSPPSPPQHKVRLLEPDMNIECRRNAAWSRRAIFLALVISSALAADQLSRLARRSRWTVLAFPLFTSTSLLLVLLLVRRCRSDPRNRTGLAEAVREVVSDGDAAERWRACATGSTFVVSLALEVWGLRGSDMVVHQAFEVAVLPMLVLILAQSKHKSRTTQDPLLATVAGGVALFAGLALVGSSDSKLGLTFSLLRVPVEASLFSLLRGGMADTDERRRSDWLLGSVVSAISFSSVLLPIGLFFPHTAYVPTLSPFSYLLSFTTVVLYALFVFLLLVAFAISESPLLPTFYLVPRNFINLGVSLCTKGDLRGTRAQLAAVYIVGSGASASVREEADHDEGDVEKGKESVDERNSSPSAFTLLSLVPVLFIAIEAIVSPTATSLSNACSYVPLSLRPSSCPPTLPALASSSVDLVVAYYDESLEDTRANLDYIRRVTFIAERDSRVIIYNKGRREESALRDALGLESWDRVINLENVGREGATYLQHILRNYNETVASISAPLRTLPGNSLSPTRANPSSPENGLADHTFFLQPHLAWTGIAKPRLWTIPRDVGFASFGPLHLSRCGEDSGHGSYPYLVSVYNMFRGRLCPPEGAIIAWSAQFVVSRSRILANPYSAYAELSRLIEAPAGHWLQDLWGPDSSGGPPNPTFGHTVERAWPTIFDCADPGEIDASCFGERVGATSKRPPRPRREPWIYAALVLSSTLASDQVTRLARRSRLTVLSFPLWASITLLVALYLAKPRSKPQGEKSNAIGASVGALWRKGKGGKRVWLTGGTWVGSFALRVWSARWTTSQELGAIETFVLPSLVLLRPSLNSSASTATRERSQRIEAYVAGVAFFGGLALVGTSGSQGGLILAIARIPLEAASIALFKEGISQDDEDLRFEWMLGAATSATLLSSLLLPIALFFPRQTFWPALSPITYLLSLSSLLFYLTHFALLLFALRTFDSPLTPASSIIPRNAITIALSLFSSGLSGLAGTSLKLLTISLGGAVAICATLRSQDHEELDEEAIEDDHAPRRTPSALTYLSFVSLAAFAISSTIFVPAPSLLESTCSLLPRNLQFCPSHLSASPTKTVDIVVSAYNESLSVTRSNLDYVRRVTFVTERDARVIVYNKGEREESVLREALGLHSWDQVIKLENVGREGATYLRHILSNYNDTLASISPVSTLAPSPPLRTLAIPEALANLPSSSSSRSRRGLADHTFFLQYHLAWTGISKPRLWTIPRDVGFASFGPLHHSRCGDEPGTEHHPLLRTVYSLFRERLCPPEGLIIAWSAQFVVSRSRILANSYSKYAELSQLIEAPAGHWMHALRDPFGELGEPSNPAFGHVLERSWPTIFSCEDPGAIREECRGEKIGFLRNCYCRDV
ncbi:hypothetical protein JCM11491_005924 [Sporobolomyces phaffii]